MNVREFLGKLRPSRSAAAGMLVFIVVSLILVYFFSSIIERGVTSQQVTTASQLVLQMDAFLVTGSIIGFFYFYGGLARTMSSGARVLYRYQGILKRSGKTYDLTEFKKKSADARSGLIVYEIVTTVFFVQSGFLAVAGVFSPNPIVVAAALVSTLLAVSFMFSSWRELARLGSEFESVTFEALEELRKCD